METYALSLTLKLPECMNVKDFLACNLNPVVVLTDFRKSFKNVPIDTPPATPLSEEVAQTPGIFPSPESPPPATPTPALALAPAPAPAPTPTLTLTTTPSPSPSPAPAPTPAPTPTPTRARATSNHVKAVKRKRKSWDPSLEYEIEKIIGYHRDKHNKMWYFVKWKNWSSEHNTFEPIANLTGCHYELMRYFEMVPPSPEAVKRKNADIAEGLRKRDIYKRLVGNGYKAVDLNEFSRKCLDLKTLFETNDLTGLERDMQKEYEYIVRCLIGMYAHQDPGLVLRAQNYKLFLKLIKVRRRQLQKNAAIQRRINACEVTPLAIENKVDLETFPDINYVVDVKIGEGVVIPKEPLLGCECPDGCTPKSRCCGKMADSSFAYGNNGRLRTSERIAIYECNSRCKCPPTCVNRVVQCGRQVKLCMFKTKSCGWGVKTMERIPKGTFVCQYVGELIPDSEAVVRDVKYLREKRSGYLFDLDFFEDAQLDMYCIDATEHGNVARFINHSCDPNLVVYPVWINCLEPNLHLLAFFAKRNINKDEEIHFDYENLQEGAREEADDDVKSWGLRMMSSLRCQCKAANCREWVFGNK